MDRHRADGGQRAGVTAPFGTATPAEVLDGEPGGTDGALAGPVDLAALVVAQQDVIDRLVTVHRELRTAVSDLNRRVRVLERGAPPAAGAGAGPLSRGRG